MEEEKYEGDLSEGGLEVDWGFIQENIEKEKDPITKIQLNLINNEYKKQKQLEKIRDREISELEKKYQKLAEPFQKEVRDIVSGERLVNDKNIPFEQYWFVVLSNCQSISEEIQKQDKKALQSLRNIWVEKADAGYDYTVIFDFAENEFFPACILRKHFQLKDEETPIKSTCNQKIQWKQGKDLTKQNGIKDGKPIKSFFNFFNDTSDKENKKNIKMSLDDQEDLADEIMTQAVPSSLEYYLNIMDDDSEGEGEGEESSENEKKQEKSKFKSKKKYEGGW